MGLDLDMSQIALLNNVCGNNEFSEGLSWPSPAEQCQLQLSAIQAKYGMYGTARRARPNDFQVKPSSAECFSGQTDFSRAISKSSRVQPSNFQPNNFKAKPSSAE